MKRVDPLSLLSSPLSDYIRRADRRHAHRNHVTNYWKKFRISHSFETDRRHDRRGAPDVSWLPMACERMSVERIPRRKYNGMLHRCIGIGLHLMHRYARTSASCRIIISISRVAWKCRAYTRVAMRTYEREIQMRDITRVSNLTRKRERDGTTLEWIALIVD